MRHFALLLLCACSTLTSEEEAALVSCQRNASLYYEGGRFSQAMGQIERGLELSPDDYKLNALRGAILLRTSATAMGTDHAQLDEATALLARVFDERSPNRHEPYLLTSYALALQKQGLRHLGEAVRLEGQASRAVGNDIGRLEAEAAAQRQEARGRLEQAFSLLDVLIDRGELLRLAHNHRLQIARQLGNDAAFLAATDSYLAQVAKDQQWLERDLRQTNNAVYEDSLLDQLRTLRAEELEVRSMVAQYHYDQRQFEAALTQLDRVLELDPQRSVDYYNRGRVLLELKRDEAAKADFRRFLVDPALPATHEKVAFAARAIDK